MSSPARIHEPPAAHTGDGDALPSPAPARSRVLVALFAATLFTSAFLMFVIEPMVARMVLPILGGAPAVWNTCLVFFQAMLLGGYAYAHGATQYLGVRRHAVVHCALIATPLLVLPVGLHGSPPQSTDSPVAWLLLVLFSSIGLPFFVLSTSAAVFQKWFASTDDEAAADPYFLYTASNLGSFIALLAYPVLIEPTLRLQDQARVWTIGYVAFIAMTVTCAVAVWRRGPIVSRPVLVTAKTTEPSMSWLRRGRWIALAFVPSSLLLAVTNYISTDVASMPLLWIAPLSLYLLGFVIAFGADAPRARTITERLMPLFVIVLALVLISDWTSPLSAIIALHLVAFFVVALACHADLAHDRPSSGRLTEFYFWIAFGGVLGGLFNALVAPVTFDGIAEYPLVLVAACVLRRNPQSAGERQLVLADAIVPLAIGLAAMASVLVNNHVGAPRFIVLAAALPALVAFAQRHHAIRFAASVAVILLAGMLAQSRFGPLVYVKRTFFGVNRVRVDTELGYRFMFHGTTLHGMQSLTPARGLEPTSYYHRAGPIGQVFGGVPQAFTASNVAIIGLGVGTLASYRSPSQQWTYYEIDPVVAQIARNDAYFTYLKLCGEDCRVVTGDGRRSLGHARTQQYGLIILDAFSSDAVPMHLMTKEALALYVSKLAPGGVIAFHISNLHFSFKSILARLASDAGLVALWQQEPPDAGSWAIGKFPSEWLLVARDRVDFGVLVNDPRWKVPVAPADTPLWTDDFSNILSALR